MKTARSIRPISARGEAVSRTVLSVVRILIASYFLATATGLIFEPGSRTFLDTVLDPQKASLITTVYLFCTAFLVMVGKLVRISALLLAVYIFWSGFLHYDQGGDTAALTVFWRDMALLGAILLIAVTEPGGSARFRLFRKTVAPRRIAVTPATARADTPRPAAEHRPGQLAPLSIFEIPEDDEDDEATGGDNIFSDLWENPLMQAMPQGSR